jgi:hypothetical protein
MRLCGGRAETPGATAVAAAGGEAVVAADAPPGDSDEEGAAADWEGAAGAGPPGGDAAEGSPLAAVPGSAGRRPPPSARAVAPEAGASAPKAEALQAHRANAATPQRAEVSESADAVRVDGIGRGPTALGAAGVDDPLEAPGSRRRISPSPHKGGSRPTTTRPFRRWTRRDGRHRTGCISGSRCRSWLGRRRSPAPRSAWGA